MKNIQTEHELIRTNKRIGTVSFLITLGRAAKAIAQKLVLGVVNFTKLHLIISI